MSTDVSRDQLTLIRVEGMHCHKCEVAIRKAIGGLPGVFEVEVDFPSSLASVLYDPAMVSVPQLMEAVVEAGYEATGFSQHSAD